jgi:hydroxymethylglutaryl-CoA lyase
MTMPDRVTIREVGLRDGIQSLGAFIPTDQKIALVDALSETGVTRIEATSFVHPKYVPQMADAEEVMQRIQRKPGVSYEVLIPNVRGLERAVSAQADLVYVVTAASDAFNQRNLRMSVDESLDVTRQIKEQADARGMPLAVAISTAFGCPYSGDVPLEQVLRVVGRLVELGYAEITLADTTGMANPIQVERTVGAVLDRFGQQATFGLHFHNTRGMGLANVVAGLGVGVTIYDASLGGIGGCPFAPRATGNICTEDAVLMLHEMGIQTGIDVVRLIEVARMAEGILGQTLPGQVMKAGPIEHHPTAAAAA